MFRKAAVAAAAFLAAAPALADPALVYSSGGKFDKSFNEGAWNGAKAWAAETGGSFGEFEIASPAQSEQALRTFARRGYSPVVAIGFTHANALAKVAPEFPDTQFAIVDMVVDAPNVQSIVYREHEGGYVVGLIGALTSKSKILGFVGGMDIPLIRKFECGYRQGAAAAATPAKVLSNMTGTTPAAWSDPARGAELAAAQIAQGADVVMQAAGGTGIGVLQAAADNGALGIGTDSNQNGLHPGKILTTMLKRVDVAVQRVFAEGGWQPGIDSLGVAEGGIGWALDEHNRALVTPEVEAAADAAMAAIDAGEISVHDSSMQGPCPVE
ncbi:BMP family lipoprotein [Rhodovulum sp. DZ06]|uniref:BMP family lipoprotein n=1 Tax=Rhodovulum sp. DZ06 TaxID=3425126 RepID=UPI003D358965